MQVTFTRFHSANHRPLRAGVIAVMIGLTALNPLRASQAADSDYGYFGPKKTIAVARFDAHGGFIANYGSWDIGGGLAAMMVSELEKTNRFRVVSRSDLDAVFREQEYSMRGLTATDTVKAGRLLGAQYLIRGSVTEFDAAEKGKGISFGGKLGGVLGSLSPRSQTGHVTIDISVIDSTTGLIVETFTAEKKIKSRALALNLAHRDFSFGGDNFSKTSLGKAARGAISQAVDHIASAMTNLPWEAQVAQVHSNKLFVNAGMDSGLRVGDTLHIHRVTEQIIDPVTGEILGSEETEIGTAEVQSVKDRYAVASFDTFMVPLVGDTLRLSPANFNQTAQLTVAAQ